MHNWSKKSEVVLSVLEGMCFLACQGYRERKYRNHRFLLLLKKDETKKSQALWGAWQKYTNYGGSWKNRPALVWLFGFVRAFVSCLCCFMFLFPKRAEMNNPLWPYDASVLHSQGWHSGLSFLLILVTFLQTKVLNTFAKNVYRLATFRPNNIFVCIHAQAWSYKPNNPPLTQLTPDAGTAL